MAVFLIVAALDVLNALLALFVLRRLRKILLARSAWPAGCITAAAVV